MICYTNNSRKEILGKILFLGDSITNMGEYISFLDTYFKLSNIDSEITLLNAGVSSETISGLSEPDHPFDRPCIRSRVCNAMELLKPDWVIINYGINDGIYYPLNKERFDAFKNGYISLINSIKKYECKIIAMTPMPFDSFSFQGVLADETDLEFSYLKPYKNYNDVMNHYSRWILDKLPNFVDKTVDLYTPLSNDILFMRNEKSSYISGDGIHPNLHGHLVIAQTILREVFHIQSETFPEQMEYDNFTLFHLLHNRNCLLHNDIIEKIGHDNPFKSELLTKECLNTETQQWNQKILNYITENPVLTNKIDTYKGFERHTFFFEGYEAIYVIPKKKEKTRSWIYRTEFFGAFDEADMSMVTKGRHLFFLRLSDQYGSAASADIMNRFRSYMVGQYNLEEKGILFGFSRGGLYALSYVSMYPQFVSALYLDAPVVDIRSWPGKYKEGVCTLKEWQECKISYDLTDETIEKYDQILNTRKNSLAENHIPMVLVAGNSDSIVPYSENGEILIHLYLQNEIPHLLILKEGVGHHPHSLKDPGSIVSFLLKYS